MNVLSLFDGISCGQIALNRAGIKYDNYFASEIDKYAIWVSKKNYPNTIALGDVRNIDYKTLPKIDIVLAGSPCQGFSNAGKKLGFNDERSKLFFEVVKCLEIINPKYFIFENVNMIKEWQDVISKNLGITPVRINSSKVSAQLRDRLYWSNIKTRTDLFGHVSTDIPQPRDRKFFLKDIIDCGYTDKDKSYCITHNYGKGATKSNKYCRTIIYDTLNKNTYRLLTPVECERAQTIPENYTEGVSKSQRYKMIGNGWTVDVISHILSLI